MPDSPTLVTSYAFAPYNDTAGIVAAKRVREHGGQVHVIANAMDSLRAIDPSLTHIAGEQVDRFIALDTPTAFASWPSVFHFATEGYRTVRRWESEGNIYEQVYSRAQFAASHILAARVKAGFPEKRWVAEFSDPLSHDVVGAVRKAPWGGGLLSDIFASEMNRYGYQAPQSQNTFEWAETLAFALADEIIFTNRSQQQVMLEWCNDPQLAERVESISRISPHPTLPREFYSLVESKYQLARDRLNIGYFGNFYTSRGIGGILSAIRESPRRVRDSVCLHIFTSRPDELLEEVSELDLRQEVRVNPYVDYLEFLNLTDKMDVLLVNDAVTPPQGTKNPFLPSKWSDYKGSSSEVWAVTEEGSSLDSEPGITYKSPVQHQTALQSTLIDLVANR